MHDFIRMLQPRGEGTANARHCPAVDVSRRLPHRRRLAVTALLALCACTSATPESDPSPGATGTLAASPDEATPRETAASADVPDLTGVTSPLDLDAFSFTWDEELPASRDTSLFTQAWGRAVAPDRLECNVGQSVGSAADPEILGFVQTVVIGDRAWIDDGGGWRETTPDDEEITSAMFYCGSAWNAQVAGRPDFGEPDTYEGIPVRVGDLVEEGMVAEVVVGEADVTLRRFEVVVTESGMLVRSEMAGVGSAAALAATAGWEYEGPADDVGEYHQRLTITDLNDPSLRVEEPEDGG